MISEDNFTEYFTDIRKQPRPLEGQVLARWMARGDFVDGWVKRNVIEVLAISPLGAETAQKIMRNMVGAVNPAEICLEMAEDLVAGMSPREVADKRYRFTVQQFYWAKPEHIPDDPHWSTITMVDHSSVLRYNDPANEENHCQ